MDRFDVAVVGAGPAGCAAALAARRAGADVALLDKADFPRDKPCGDCITPHTLTALARLGITDSTLGYPLVTALHMVSPGGQAVTRRLRMPVYTVPRHIFDSRLVDHAVAAGVHLRRHRLRHLEIRDGDVTIDGAVAAKIVVGADGANSAVRRAVGFRTNPGGHLALAIRGYAPMHTIEHQTHMRIVTTPGVWPAYAWSFPIGDGSANVGYGQLIGDGGLAKAALADRMAALMPSLDLSEVVQLRGHHLPVSTFRPACGNGRVVLAGDAMSLVNPFTGEGICYAVVSGTLAGAAAVASLGDGAAAHRYTSLLKRCLGGQWRYSALAARLGRHSWLFDAAIRAARGDQVVFDSMVALGLGDGRLHWGVVARALWAATVTPSGGWHLTTRE